MENLNIKKTTQDVLKWTTIGGSAVISVGAIMALTKVKDVKSAIMPLVTLLVGVSAFSYAMTEKVGFIPKTDGKTEEPK